MLHFTYEPAPSSSTLMQGDVLRRTPEMDELLKAIHPHFHQNKENLFFIVLTQSCDLDRRDGGEACKAPYITISPVRTLDTVVERYLAKQPRPIVEADMLVLSAKTKTKASEFLVRIFNNNEPGYFYLDSEDTELPCDCVAFLNLSIAIKADFHYEKCLAAKVSQLTETFQAKLGWLVGQMYSRVGTNDFDRAKITSKTIAALKDAAFFIDDQKVAAVESVFREFQGARPGAKMSTTEISKALKKIPTRKQLVLEQTEKIIKETLGSDNEAIHA